MHFLCTRSLHTCFVVAGLLLAFFCVTKRQKLEIDDVGDSGGILLKSNIEAPGDEVVRT